MFPGQYTNSLLNLCCCKSRCSKKNLPIDGYIILLVAVLGVIMEIVTGKPYSPLDLKIICLNPPPPRLLPWPKKNRQSQQGGTVTPWSQAFKLRIIYLSLWAFVQFNLQQIGNSNWSTQSWFSFSSHSIATGFRGESLNNSLTKARASGFREIIVLKCSVTLTSLCPDHKHIRHTYFYMYLYVFDPDKS